MMEKIFVKGETFKFKNKKYIVLKVNVKSIFVRQVFDKGSLRTFGDFYKIEI